MMADGMINYDSFKYVLKPFKIFFLFNVDEYNVLKDLCKVDVLIRVEEEKKDHYPFYYAKNFCYRCLLQKFDLSVTGVRLNKCNF